MKLYLTLALSILLSISAWANQKDSVPTSQIDKIKHNIQFIQTYPDSTTSLDYLYFYRIDLPIDKLDELFTKISDRLKHTSKGLELGKDIKWRHTITKKINNYILLDTNNNKINLSDLIKSKKYTLIDFWGSWCIPCRNDAPNLIALNNKYSSGDFGIISISEDVNTKDWLEGIRTDKTNKWTHLIDSKRFIQNDLGIESIPRKLLLNDKLEVIGVYTSNFYGKSNLEADLNKLTHAPHP
jgi:thiol-disulfide isomerase/thioredoxin